MKFTIFLLFCIFNVSLFSQDFLGMKDILSERKKIEEYYIEKYQDTSISDLINRNIPLTFFDGDTLIIVSYVQEKKVYLYDFFHSSQDSIIRFHLEEKSSVYIKKSILNDYIIDEINKGKLACILEKGKHDSILSTNPVFLRILIAFRKMDKTYEIESYTLHSFIPN